MKDFILANAKAITALVVSILASVASKLALHLDDATETEIAGLVVALAVWLVPNTPKPTPPPPPAPASLPPVLRSEDVTKRDRVPVVKYGVPHLEADVWLATCAAMTGWVLMAAAFCGCTPKTAHDVAKLSIDDLNCVMDRADSGEDTQVIALECGLSSLPDIMTLVEDLVATEKAAHRAGRTWHHVVVHQ